MEQLPRCDIVMKGGITSGVVYPLAAVELSKEYRFANVGGTSAGAIAAAAVAAAEVGRANERGPGFERLAALPRQLQTQLSGLFQPQQRTRPLYRVLAAGLGQRGLRRAAVTVAALLRSFPVGALVGAGPGVVLAAVAATTSNGWEPLRWLSLAFGIVLAGAGLLLGSAAAASVRFVRSVPDNCFGLCSGMPSGHETQPALTPWLADLLDELAGMPQGRPLTFGDLWGTADPHAERLVNLEVMTTNLTTGRPHRLPLTGSQNQHAYFFDPDEMRRLFPERIVSWMERNARESTISLPPGSRLVPLPLAAELPVVVATRMSLSFPLLISAVPLHAIDWAISRPDEQRPERNWFSDGGITSNFPVHFFDSPLPRWPTFAITLEPYPRSAAEHRDPAASVWMPSGNEEGIASRWISWDEKRPLGRLAAFLRAILDTMQNWMDNAQSTVPGYRDRIVHIRHSAKEGGMNLTMPPPVVKELTERGRRAGDLLVERFGPTPPPGVELTWLNHRWVRYRSTMALLEQALSSYAKAYHCTDLQPSYADLIRRDRTAPPPSYRWRRLADGEAAGRMTDDLIALTEAWATTPPFLGEEAPRPRPELRIVPRF
jgi:predicted acylesterase/phospholipase RssA